MSDLKRIEEGDVALDEDKKSGTKKPRRFRVILHNDDYTTMEFVVEILENIFHKAPAEAAQIMLAVHKKGQGTAGTYSREVAETKVEQVRTAATQEGFPLQASFEPA